MGPNAEDTRMPSYLTSRPSRKGGRRYYFKLRIPEECRAEFGGRTVIVEALKTSDRDAAEIEAHALAKSHLDRIKVRRLELAREKALALNLTASEREVLQEAGGLPRLVQALAQSRKEAAFTEAAASVLANVSAAHERAPDAPDVDYHPLDQSHEAAAEAWTKTVVSPPALSALEVRREAREAEAGAAAAKDLLSTVESVVQKERSRAQAEKRGLVARGRAEDAPEPQDPEPAGEPKPRDTLRSVMERYLRETKAPPHRTGFYAYAVRRFEELHPRKRLAGIDKRTLSEFRDAVQQLPASSRDDVRKGTIKQAIAIADKDGLPRVSDITVKRHVDAIGTLLRFAADEGFIDAAPRIRNRITRTLDDDENDRQPFSDEQLTTLWAALDASRAAPRDKRHREPSDDDWWLPRVALCSGMRVEEIAQLEKADVRLEDGIHVFDVNSRGGKKLKSRAARRLVPIHPKLIELGFLEFVAASPGPLIFSSLPSKDGRNRLAAAYGKRFAALLRKKAKITDERLVFHSFRHTFATKARAAGISEEELGRLLGHSAGASVTAGYGKGPGVRRLSELVQGILMPKLR